MNTKTKRHWFVAIVLALIAGIGFATVSSGTAIANGTDHPDCEGRVEIQVDAETWTVPAEYDGWGVWSKAGDNPHTDHGNLAAGTTIDSGIPDGSGYGTKDISHVDLCPPPPPPPEEVTVVVGDIPCGATKVTFTVNNPNEDPVNLIFERVTSGGGFANPIVALPGDNEYEANLPVTVSFLQGEEVVFGPTLFESEDCPPEPCPYDDSLTADDERCVPPPVCPEGTDSAGTPIADLTDVNNDGEVNEEDCNEPEPCPYDDSLTADDERCVPPTTTTTTTVMPTTTTTTTVPASTTTTSTTVAPTSSTTTTTTVAASTTTTVKPTGTVPVVGNTNGGDQSSLVPLFIILVGLLGGVSLVYRRFRPLARVKS